MLLLLIYPLNNSETKQRTLEELDQVFSVPVGVFAKYQVTKSLPYFFKRWVLFQRNATLEPLYKVDQEMDGDKVLIR